MLTLWLGYCGMVSGCFAVWNLNDGSGEVAGILSGLMRIPAAMNGFLEKALPRFRGDERLVGVAAGGSWIRGTLDEQSDVDLVVVARDDAFARMMNDRMEIARGLGPLLVAFTGEHVGEPRLLICLYGPPLVHVDLKFVALKDFAARVEDPAVLWERDGALTALLAATKSEWPAPQLQWIEDRFWVWVHYAAGKLARGELFEVMDMLTYMRSMILGPLVMQAEGQRAQGARRIETHAVSWVPKLRETIATYDARSCGDSLEAAVMMYRELRERLAGKDLVRRTEAEQEVMEYLKSVRRD